MLSVPGPVRVEVTALRGLSETGLLELVDSLLDDEVTGEDAGENLDISRPPKPELDRGPNDETSVFWVPAKHDHLETIGDDAVFR